MITVILSKNKADLFLKSHYYYKDRIKRLPNKRFDYESKAWVIPVEDLGVLMTEFEGELYFKTPLWKILRKPCPKPVPKTLYRDDIKAPALNFPPYDYQDKGIRFMVDRVLRYGFVMNADSVGLGKTIQTIGTLKWFIENKGCKKILIICKKSLKMQWKNEIAKFSGFKGFPACVTQSVPKKQRAKMYEDFAKMEKGILITNYHNFLNDSEDIAKSNYDFSVIDEVHKVKAYKGKMNNYIGNIIKNTNTVFLTGTPIMSKPEDIFGIMQMAGNNPFGENFKKFSDKYLVYANTTFGWQCIGAKNLKSLRDEMRDLLIRRTAESVSIQLPDVITERILVEPDETQLNIINVLDSIKEDFAQSKKDLLVKGVLPEENKEALDAILDKEKGLIPPSQFAADDPRCFLNSKLNKEFKAQVPKGYVMSSKNEATIDIIENILDAGSKVIVFTRLKTPAKLLCEDIKKKLKTNVLMYTGEESDEKREDNISKFVNSDDYNILIGNEACAEGLNLQAANFIINYEQADTYAQYNQRIGRACRAGSEHAKVHVYNMVTNDSFDVSREEKIEKDKNLSAAILL